MLCVVLVAEVRDQYKESKVIVGLDEVAGGIASQVLLVLRCQWLKGC